MLRRRARQSRIATNDIVALGFSPMFKNERALSRIATTDINPKYALTLIVHNIGRADGTYTRFIIYARWVKTQRYNISRADGTYQPSTCTCVT